MIKWKNDKMKMIGWKNDKMKNDKMKKWYNEIMIRWKNYDMK